MTRWQTRESAKQARCREQNESAVRARITASDDLGESSFRCECGDAACTCAIELTRSEYEWVRGLGTRFAVARNHENPENEVVIEENGRFAIVETVVGEATKLARTSDPRQRRRERCWQDAAAGKPGDVR